MHPHSLGCWSGALLSAVLLTTPLAHARELTTIDALGAAPIAQQRKAAPALPAHVSQVSREERLGVATFVQLRPPAVPTNAARTKAAADPTSAARSELKALAGLYGLTVAEIDAAPLHHVQALPGGAHLVRLTNQREGIEVFREQATVLLNAQSQATAVGGYLGSTAPAPHAKAMRAMALDMPGAIALALQDWGFDAGVAQQLQAAAPPTQSDPGPYQWWALPAAVAGADGATLPDHVRAKPVWFRMPQGLVAAYYLELLVHEDGQEHAWAYVVAQDDGRLLLRHNQTAHAGEFSYRVFADPATLTPWPGAQGRNGTPHPTGLPDGYAAPLEAPSLLNLANLPFSRNDPWLPPGATQTLGNNVHAFANLAAPDNLNPGDENQCGDDLGRDFRACTTGPSQFDYVYDHAQGPLASKAQAAASAVNLFYVNNWLHDWFYDAGFDEAAGNAQTDNFGRGGLGGDALRVQVLDYGGTNNANMLTLADGAASRMRMYRYANAMLVPVTVSSPVSIAGSYAAGKAIFGPQSYLVTGEVVAAQDASARPAEACFAIATNLTGKIALVDRGNCNFADKVMNAQNAGAVGVVVVDNAPGAPTGLGGTGPLVTIPAIRLSQADGAAWKARLVAGDTVTLNMQSTSGTDRSSAFDNGIIAHEWGHFISNRLIGDASGLTSNHARGLGEGWGDFHALLMTATAADRSLSGNDQYQGAYTAGNYAMAPVIGPAADLGNAALFGIRRYPYSTDLTKNPLTLQHITDGVPLPGLVTAPRNLTVGQSNAEEHNMGEVWASMLWECYVSLLNAHPFNGPGSDGAQERMKRYLVAAYKLTPVNPTLLEARDALLAVAAANDPADYHRFVHAFAKRGAGPFARVPDRYSTTNAGVVESYSTSGVLVIEKVSLSMAGAGTVRCDGDDVLDSGETGRLVIRVRNAGGGDISDGTFTLSSDVAGVSFPDSPVAVARVFPGASVVIETRVQLTGLAAASEARITASLSYTRNPGTETETTTATLDIPLHRDELPSRSTSDGAEALVSAMTFGSSVAGREGTWAVKRVGAQDHRYAGAAPDGTGSHWMRTPVLQVAPTGAFKVSFKHRHRFERDGGIYYDGGQLMISPDGGTTWNSVGSAAGYNGTINGGSGNPADGQGAYVGESAGWPGMVSTTVNLGTAYAGLPVRLAWVVQTDQGVATEGWEVDDIAFTGITNAPFPQVVADHQICAPGLVAVDGTPQSAVVNAAFPWPLKLRLRGAAGAVLSSEMVTISVPGSGASTGPLPSGALTDLNGLVELSMTANGIAGSYVVTATAGGHSASFALTNLPGPTANSATAVGSATRSAWVGAAFAPPLLVEVRDTDGVPMAGQTVAFAAPVSGASATLSGASAVTNALGQASVTATANGTVGTYAVTATVYGTNGAYAAVFQLTNTPLLAGTLTVLGGDAQSASVGTAFAQALRLRLLDGGGAPIVGVPVVLSGPASGASVAVLPVQAVTDVSGDIQVIVAANTTPGAYAITASYGGQTVQWQLRNTAAPVGSGGGAQPLVIQGNAPGGQGTVVATVQNPPAHAYFSQALFDDEAGAGVPPMPGYQFPFGLTGFVLENVGRSGTVTLRIQYPGPVPAGAEYWKYGRTPSNMVSHWHQVPMVQVAPNAIELALQDGGVGDTDARADGTITDPGGLRMLAAPLPGAGGAAAIPVLSPWMLLLLIAGLGWLGGRGRRSA